MSEIAKLVAVLDHDVYRDYGAAVGGASFALLCKPECRVCKLEAALVTAPPEQAQPEGDKEDSITRRLREAREEATLAEHKSHLEFENELYATLVDPIAEGSIKEAEMRKQLLEQARWYRQRVYDLEQALPLDARRLKMILLDVIVLADAGKWKGQLSTVNYARAALASGAVEKK